MTDWLLQRGVAVNHGDNAGVTPVMISAQGGSAQLLSVLLEHGADLHACSAAGCNALHFASCSGKTRPTITRTKCTIVSGPIRDPMKCAVVCRETFEAGFP